MNPSTPSSPSSTAQAEGARQSSVITADAHSFAGVNHELLQPLMDTIPPPLRRYITTRNPENKTFRCSNKVAKAYGGRVIPARFDNPLNDYILHFPFFRREIIFPLSDTMIPTKDRDPKSTTNTSGFIDFKQSKQNADKVKGWVESLLYVEDWNGSESSICIPKKSRMIPPTLLR